MIARAVADSPLVKTAIHGADPNWGRIVSAAGYPGCSLRSASSRLASTRCNSTGQRTPCPFDAASLSRSIRDNREDLACPQT